MKGRATETKMVNGRKAYVIRPGGGGGGTFSVPPLKRATMDSGDEQFFDEMFARRRKAKKGGHRKKKAKISRAGRAKLKRKAKKQRRSKRTGRFYGYEVAATFLARHKKRKGGKKKNGSKAKKKQGRLHRCKAVSRRTGKQCKRMVRGARKTCGHHKNHSAETEIQ